MLKSRTQSIRLWSVDDEEEVIRQYDSMRTSLVLNLEASSGLDKGWNVSPRVEEPGTTLGPQKQYMPTPLDTDCFTREGGNIDMRHCCTSVKLRRASEQV